ncbi:hypothetical protein AA449_26485 [Salmonella enterica subsp. enterica serovar Newport]|nr:hypothetical protein [Salmonella enterica subsp. enterica serovar Newport]
MARIRTIKPEFWTDEKIVECSFEARLMFIGMLNFADDKGNLVRSPKRIKMQIFPADTIDCEPLIKELSGAGLISEYSVSGAGYIHINGFSKHQKINRPSATTIPTPEEVADNSRKPTPNYMDGSVSDGEKQSCDSHTSSGIGNEDSVSAHGELIDGREGKGREEELKDQNTLSDFGSNRTADEKPASPEKPPAPENPEPEQVADRGSGNSPGPEPEPDQGIERAGDSDPPDKPDDRDKPCEPDPVDQAFGDIFWKAGLCKVGKVKACSAFRSKYRAWKKSTHGSPPEFASMLASDIRQRLSAGVFGMDKLHPATYLNQERWNDEMPEKTPVQPGDAPQVRETSGSWCTPAGDGSSEVFVNFAALERTRRGYGDR